MLVLRTLRAKLVPALVAVAIAATGCGSDGSDGASGPADTLRLGYFANVTHAGAVYAAAEGIYQDKLGATELKTQVFNAGPAAVEALFAGALDAAYLGPGPAVNAFIRSRGDVVVVAGATSGGAAFVVRSGVTVDNLRGKRFADPQTGGTQDIALRTYLAGKGLEVDRNGAGDVKIQAQDNSQTLDLFKSGDLDGAWVPEPWASRLVVEGNGTVLVDEQALWPGGRFVTTHLVVRKEFLAQHPETIKAVLLGQVEANQQIKAQPARAQTVVNAALKELTGKALAPAVITRAFSEIELTEDPLAATLVTTAEHAFASGLVKKGSLRGFYDLRILREVLGTDVDDAGLGQG